LVCLLRVVDVFAAELIVTAYKFDTEVGKDVCAATPIFTAPLRPPSPWRPTVPAARRPRSPYTACSAPTRPSPARHRAATPRPPVAPPATASPRSPARRGAGRAGRGSRCACRSEEHTSELQSRFDLVCRLLLEKK